MRLETLLEHLDVWSEAIIAAGSYPKRVAGVTNTGGGPHLGPGLTIDIAAEEYQQEKGNIMTFMHKHRFRGNRTEHFLLKVSMEGELFGIGLFDTMAEMYPNHVEPLRACAAMERFNVDYCEPFAHDAGIHISEKRAKKLRDEGAKFAHKHDFTHVAKAAIRETPAADALYAHLAKHADTPKLKALGDDLYEHEARYGTGSSPN